MVYIIDKIIFWNGKIEWDKILGCEYSQSSLLLLIPVSPSLTHTYLRFYSLPPLPYPKKKINKTNSFALARWSWSEQWNGAFWPTKTWLNQDTVERAISFNSFYIKDFVLDPFIFIEIEIFLLEILYISVKIS